MCQVWFYLPRLWDNHRLQLPCQNSRRQWKIICSMFALYSELFSYSFVPVKTVDGRFLWIITIYWHFGVLGGKGYLLLWALQMYFFYAHTPGWQHDFRDAYHETVRIQSKLSARPDASERYCIVLSVLGELSFEICIKLIKIMCIVLCHVTKLDWGH